MILRYYIRLGNTFYLPGEHLCLLCLLIDWFMSLDIMMLTLYYPFLSLQEHWCFSHYWAYLDASSLVMTEEYAMIWLSHVENCVFVAVTLGIFSLCGFWYFWSFCLFFGKSRKKFMLLFFSFIYHWQYFSLIFLDDFWVCSFERVLLS